MSVIHPLLVPSTCMEAPITGPKLSLTVPVTVMFCALACVANSTKSNIIPNVLNRLDFCFININLIGYLKKGFYQSCSKSENLFAKV